MILPAHSMLYLFFFLFFFVSRNYAGFELPFLCIRNECLQFSLHHHHAYSHYLFAFTFIFVHSMCNEGNKFFFVFYDAIFVKRDAALATERKKKCEKIGETAHKNAKILYASIFFEMFIHSYDPVWLSFGIVIQKIFVIILVFPVDGFINAHTGKAHCNCICTWPCQHPIKKDIFFVPFFQ